MLEPQDKMKLVTPTLAILAAILITPKISAQTANNSQPPVAADNSPQTQQDAFLLNTFVVTGSIAPETKLDASLAITTIAPSDIETMAPRSIDELMKAVPGVYIESTGGEANNTVAARGVGAGDGFEYLAMLEDGLPVISEEDMSFSTADNYTRVSTWIASVEGLRGGSSGVLITDAPIGSINFIGREGTQQLQGEYQLQVGDYGLIRNDMWIAGPIDKNDTFAFGGFYRADNGIRNPGYKADFGGELTANFKHTFSNGRGYFKVSGKILDDHTEFELPFPLQGTSTNPQTIPGGPNINTAASQSPDMRFFSLQNTPDGPLDFDLANGIQVDLAYIGSEFDYDLARGLKIVNRNRFSTVDKSWNSNPFGVPATLQSLVNTMATSGNVPASQWANALSNGNYDFELTYPGQNGAVAAANATAAANLNGNGLGDIINYRYAGSKIRDFQDDVRLEETLDTGTTITAGLYMKTFQETIQWYFENELIDVSPSYHRLDVTFINATTGTPIGQYTYNGIEQAGTTFRHATADLDEASPYFDATQKFGNLTLDVGLRLLNMSYVGETEATQAYDLNSYLHTTTEVPALENAVFGNGNYYGATAEEHKKDYTFGANYVFTPEFSTFVRYSYGPRLPEDNVVMANGVGDTAPAAVQEITQYELGVKYTGHTVGLFATVFDLEQRNILNNGFITVNNLPVAENFLTGENVTGLELEGIWNPLRGLSVDVRGTLQDPKYVTPGLTEITSTDFVSLNGLTPTRTPKIYGRVDIGYTLPSFSLGSLTANVGVAYTGERPGNQTAAPNGFTLDPFTEVSAGLSFAFHDGFVVHLQCSNLFDSAGLTEQDPRLAAGSQVGNYFNARPLLPRSVIASFEYNF
jgi:outer membrane cobalamin receptor